MFSEKHRKSENMSKNKRKMEDLEIFRSKNRKSKAKSERKHKNNETKALKRFLDQTRFGPIFVCSCCYTRQFKENSVSMKKLKINPTILSKCIPLGQEVPVKIWLDDVKTEESYVCKTCKRHMEKGKMPPECRQNNLLIDPQPDVMKLTELSSNLIARVIQFQKIYQLPKSRYTAVKDKIINVPVPEDSVLNTVQSLPRTPNEAGLIGVELKRKIVYSNTHHSAQMVDPDQIYDALEYLKKAGNPYYQFFDDSLTYEERCVNGDDDNLFANAFHGEEDNITESLEDMPLVANPEPDDVIEGDEQTAEEEALRQEDEQRTKDPVRKFHFQYDQSIAMTNMHRKLPRKTLTRKKCPTWSHWHQQREAHLWI